MTAQKPIYPYASSEHDIIDKFNYLVELLRLKDQASASMPAQIGYGMTNVTTTRELDANSTTLDEVADVLATLINDLKSAGILG